ncbi:zinc finger protein 91-like isoform X2 [Planococcus citri]|uniref:zinc finger protein 91-like isoform X2 n=1 Tax=Planococcus citri TaxID=170843 RepID=UPI0031F9B60B
MLNSVYPTQKHSTMNDKKAESHIYDDLIANCEDLLKQNTTKYQSYLELQESLRLQFIEINHDYKRLKKWLDLANEDFLSMKCDGFTLLYELLVKHNIVKEFVNFGNKEETLQLQFLEIINECVNLKEDLDTANKSVISLKREYSELTRSSDALLENVLVKESSSYARSLEILRMNFIEIIENGENSQLILETGYNDLTKMKLEHDSLKQQYEALSENQMVKGFIDYAKYQENLRIEMAKKAKDAKETLDRIIENLASLKSQLAESNEMLNVEQQRRQRIENERDSLDKSSEKLCQLLLKYQRRKLNENRTRERSMNNETRENSVINDDSSHDCCIIEPERVLSSSDPNGDQPIIVDDEDSDNISPEFLVIASVNGSVAPSNTNLNDDDGTKNYDLTNCSPQDSPLQREISDITNLQKTSKKLKKSAASLLKTNDKVQRTISNGTTDSHSYSDTCDQLDSSSDTEVANEEEPYKCTSCDKVFTASDILDSHSAIHSLARPFKGWNPSLGFKSGYSKLLLEQYIREKTDVSFYCAHCDVRFGNKDVLAGHIRQRHFGELCKRFEYTTCEKSYSLERQLKLHKLVEHSHKKDGNLDHNMNNQINSNQDTPRVDISAVNGRQKSYNCDESKCDKTFAFRSNLKKHKLTHASKNLFKCSFCSNNFKHRFARRLHAQKYHEKYARIQCAHCDKQCYSKHSIFIHLEKCHSSTLKKQIFECSLCRKSFSSKVHLVEHESICGSKIIVKGKENRSAVVVLNKFEVSSLRCGICNGLFSCINSLNKHKRVEHDKQKSHTNINRDIQDASTARGEPKPTVAKTSFDLICAHCGKGYNDRTLLMSHVDSAHRSDNRYKCPLCDKTYSLPKGRHRHVRLFHEQVCNFVCAHCDRAFRFKQTLISHMNSHFAGALIVKKYKRIKPTGPKLFKCGICDHSFHYAHDLRRHENRRHTIGRSVECPHCDKCFKEVYARNAHVQRVHEGYGKKTKNPEVPEKSMETSERLVQCSFCDKSFFSLFTRNAHVRRVHTNIGSLACEHCDQTFTYKNVLLTHMHSHFPGQLVKIKDTRRRDKSKLPRSFKCSSCDQAFYCASHLKRHHATAHSELRPYKCPHCDKSFKTTCHRNEHARGVHKEYGRKPEDARKSVEMSERLFQCSVCDKSFFRVSNRNAHVRKVHAKIPRFACAHCEQTFVYKSVLQTHMHSHFPGQLVKIKDTRKRDRSKLPRKFKCSSCDKAFHSASVLSRHHVTVHTSLRPYKCPQCGKSFKTISHRNEHVRGVHEGARVNPITSRNKPLK